MNLFELLKIKFSKPEYTLEGECLKCGNCCKTLYTLDDYTTFDFKITQFLFPKYKRLNVIGKDENGNIILSCRWLTPDNKCRDYKNRLTLCKNFPNVKYGSLGQVPEGCGYRLVPIKKFKDILEKTSKANH